MREIKIYTPFILLHQALKLSGIISTGGAAKYFLLSNVIYVNKEEEKRRGRKLYPGDVLEFQGEEYLISK